MFHPFSVHHTITHNLRASPRHKGWWWWFAVVGGGGRRKFAAKTIFNSSKRFLITNMAHYSSYGPLLKFHDLHFKQLVSLIFMKLK
jgi:hypothetical protein